MKAIVRFSWEDIQDLKPDWTEKECKGWLEDNARYVENALVMAGWEIINALFD